MPRTAAALSLTSMLCATDGPAARPRRSRLAAVRRTTANLALAMGVMATAVSLGILVGHLGRALIGG
ncbi:hypothetical protein BH11PSE1_BH11PSE1_22420 [soil metagenome]